MSEAESEEWGSLEDRRAAYIGGVRMLDELAAIADRHVQLEECMGVPLCIGDADAMLAGMPAGPQLVLLAVALHERAKTRHDVEALEKKIAELERRLEVQRGITQDTQVACEAAEAEAEQAAEAVQQLGARISVVEIELSSALAELTLWENASDIIGPVIVPDEPA